MGDCDLEVMILIASRRLIVGNFQLEHRRLAFERISFCPLNAYGVMWHFTSYLIAVPVYPALYTYVGMFPDSFLAQHTQPHPAIPVDV